MPKHGSRLNNKEVKQTKRPFNNEPKIKVLTSSR